MMSFEDINLTTSEYKFTFRQSESAQFSERHFSAPNPEIAREIFDFACRKDDISVDEVDLSVWNRWANRWDKVSSIESTVSE